MDYYKIQAALAPHMASSTELMAAMSSIWPLIKASDERLRKALENVKAAIEAGAVDEVITDTLWMPERLSRNETVVDYIDNTLSVTHYLGKVDLSIGPKA